MIHRSRRAVLLGSLASLALVGAACGSSSKSSDTTVAPETTVAAETTMAADTTVAETTMAPVELNATLNASGATFPKAFYEVAIDNFQTANPGVTINYAGGGSGKGRQELADQITDFGGTDGLVKDADKASYKGGEFLYFPTVVAPITVSYNLPSVKTLQLSPDTIANIFQAKITKWNDAAIAADNPGVTLPATAITVVHRSDSSGTTENFSKFLEAASGPAASGAWTLGKGSTIEWPANTQGGEGNAGVAGGVKAAEGAIGYVDLADAIAGGLQTASVKNKAGKFVAPTLEGASAAAAGAKISPDLTYFAGWADGDAAYPIAAQTWILVYKNQTDAAKGAALKAFLTYLLTDGQKIAAENNFAPLPADLDTKALAQLDQIVIPA